MAVQNDESSEPDSFRLDKGHCIKNINANFIQELIVCGLDFLLEVSGLKMHFLLLFANGSFGCHDEVK